VAPMLDSYEDAEARSLTSAELQFVSADGFGDAYDVVLGNCSMCHAREPSWEGMHWPPHGVVLETESDVARHARQIFLQAGVTHAMPPPNAISTMDEGSRATIVAWYRNATSGGD
ncbi:MAG: cysteine desulfurase, partial [Boseongicola sp. SB0670_bin_30]|nr:cysteine desulfurase [Boseongicola sp. SB0670_bin_30]